MNITIQSAQVITIDNIVLEFVRDFFIQKKIIAKVKGLPRLIVLWEGADEYASAGDWTNDTATAQATAVLSLSSIPWVV